MVAASNFTAAHNENIAASSLFTVSDTDGDALTTYQFWDSTSHPARGANGVVQATNQNINLSAAQLGSTTFQSGSVSGDLWVRVYNGSAWSA